MQSRTSKYSGLLTSTTPPPRENYVIVNTNELNDARPLDLYSWPHPDPAQEKRPPVYAEQRRLDFTVGFSS